MPRKPAARTAARADAEILNLIASVLVNPLTGAGGADDATAAAMPQAGRELQPQELARLVDTEPGNAIVSIPPLWLYCAGVEVEVDGDPAPINEAWADLRVDSAFAEGWDHARALGGAGIIVETGQDFGRPLDPALVRHITLRVLSGYHLRPDPVVLDPASPWWGQPEWYHVDSSAFVSAPIHASHVLPFLGTRRRVPALAAWRWTEWPGISVLASGWEAYRALWAASHNNESAARRLSTYIMKHPDFIAKIAEDPESFKALLDQLRQKLGTNGMIHAPPGAELNTASLSLGGLGDTNAHAYAMASLAWRIPLPVLFSQPPAGLSTDEKSWWANWTSQLTGWFGLGSWGNHAVNYRRLYDIMAPSLYAKPPALRSVAPGDFRAPTDAERADLLTKDLANATAAVNLGIVTRDRYRVVGNRLELSAEAPPTAPIADAAPDRQSTLIALTPDPMPALVRAVQNVVPGLVPEEWPHMTALYLGDVPARSMRAIERAVVEHADDWPDTLVPDYIGPLGDNGAVVLFLRAAGLTTPQSRLLRALAPEIRQRQFPRFLPHVTLGYADALTPEQTDALAQIPVPASIESGPLVLRRGDADRIRIDAEDSYAPPKGAQEAARRALEVREQKPPSERGMTPVGLARARDLANGRTLSPETVRRMKAYFDRHQSDKDGATWSEQGKGWQAWQGWGGDAGWRWATKIVKRLDTAA